MVAENGHPDASAATHGAALPDPGLRTQDPGLPSLDGIAPPDSPAHLVTLSPPHPLPPLPDDHHPILTAYLKHDADLFKVAEAAGRPLHELLQALSTSPLREYIAQATAHADEADRRLAAATLRDTIRTTDSPVEKRRAASALGRIVQITRAASAADRRSIAAERASLIRALRAFSRPHRDAEPDPAFSDDPREDRGTCTHPEGSPDSPAARHAPPTPPEPLRGHGHLSPGESVAAFLINLRTIWYATDAIPDVYTRVSGNTSMFVRMYALNDAQFRKELAAALPLLERGPWRTEPALIDGDAADVRAIFTRGDGSEAVCTFHLVKAQKHCPPDWWFVDGLTPEDSS
jgi:hypothetical protein